MSPLMSHSVLGCMTINTFMDRFINYDFKSAEQFVQSELFCKIPELSSGDKSVAYKRITTFLDTDPGLAGILKAIGKDSAKTLMEELKEKNFAMYVCCRRIFYRAFPLAKRKRSKLTYEHAVQILMRAGTSAGLSTILMCNFDNEIIQKLKLDYLAHFIPNSTYRNVDKDPYLAIRSMKSPSITTIKRMARFGNIVKDANVYIGLKMTYKSLLPRKGGYFSNKDCWDWEKDRVKKFILDFRFSISEIREIPGMEAWLRQNNLMYEIFKETDCLFTNKKIGASTKKHAFKKT